MMRDNRIEKRSILWYIGATVLVVALVAVAFVLLEAFEKKRTALPETVFGEETLYYEGKEYALRKNVETFLILGLDKFSGAVNDSYNNDQQADFLLLLVFDNDTKTCTALHINRDTMATMNVLGVAGQKVDTVQKQIALAHTYGNGQEVSCRNTAEAVSGLLFGMRINHYMSLKMDAVPRFNDLVGGVEVTVLDDFTGIDETLVKGEKVTLRGEQALHYVRTRYGLDDSSNNTRMERQRQYMNALYDKTMQCIESDDSFIATAVLEMAEMMVSDRSVNQLQELMEKLSTYTFVEIDAIEGETVLGDEYMEFYPSEASLQQIVVNLFYKPKD